ncbi:cytochrome c oxidase subunit 3 [Novosphingobium lentum]|uniref:cytochrome c oxidase subunit 3 n=1 Tax=Novosphingobium lentum TaxID=145287 RepID=UPI000831090B|nr:cytochrome c oxidase subunit 3 [Novosphingobium lentum]
MPQAEGLPTKGHVPGEPGVWVLILGDLMVFSTFFVMFAYYRGLDPATFAAGRQLLDVRLGLVNTLVLLTSSLLVAMAVHRVRAERPGAPALLLGAMGCGLLFGAIKALEYSAKIQAGIGFGSSTFFMLYFAFTAIHLLHVLLGVGVLAFMRGVAARPGAAQRMVAIESGATFWHLVDLLWIVLFALIYLVG